MTNERISSGLREFDYRGLRLLQVLCCVLTMALAGCNMGGGEAYEIPAGDMDEIEQMAYERTGDVRVYFYVKPRVVRTDFEKNRVVEQREMRHVLINVGHSLYRGVPDYRLADEERFIYNNEMHDLLIVLRDQFGFFNRGNAVNILSDDPFSRADREPNSGRIIAVQQIIDGKVNTSYFARRLNEEAIDARRARAFNDCQAIVMEVIAKAIPRGSAGQGESDADALGKR